MTTISVRLPNNYHKRLDEISSAEGISINQLITNAIGEKLSALDTEDYIQRMAKRGSRSAFEKIMNKVPDIEPEEQDAL